MSLPSIAPIDPILRMPAVIAATGLSERTIYRWIDEAKFPAPKKLGVNAVGWPQSAIKGWIDNRPDARAVAVEKAA